MSEAMVPWDFSFPGGDAKLVPNLPSPEGTALGKEIARLATVELAKDRERFLNALPPCNECAFVEGTEPNRSLATLMDAVKCMVEVVPFYCHKGIAEGDEPRRLCAGWAACVGSDAAERARAKLRGGA